MYLVLLGLTESWLALNQSFRLSRSEFMYSHMFPKSLPVQKTVVSSAKRMGLL